MKDANLVLQALVTKTASFAGAGVSIGKGGTEMVAVVAYKAATNASGSNTFVFFIEHSDDNSTFYPLAYQLEAPISLSTTAQAGEVFIPFKTKKKYVRLSETLAGAGSTPTISYLGDLGLSVPNLAN